MTTEIKLENEEIFNKIRIISNRFRFKILELTQSKEIDITTLGKQLNLSYTKCADYIKMLKDKELVIKKKEGKNVLVKSNIKISHMLNQKIIFI